MSFTVPVEGLKIPFPVEAALTSLPVFCGNGNTASILDPLVNFLQGGYLSAVRVSPSTLQQGGSNTILANQTYEDQLSIPAGSYLIKIGGHSDQTDAKFRVLLYDAGAQEYLFDGFVHESNIAGRYLPRLSYIDGASLAGDGSLFILPSPISIASPGQLNVQITNLSQNTANIDMAFYFAVPSDTTNQGATPAVVGNAVWR